MSIPGTETTPDWTRRGARVIYIPCRWATLMGTPSWQAKYTPGKPKQDEGEWARWDIAVRRLNQDHKGPALSQRAGYLALGVCPVMPEQHNARLTYSVNPKLNFPPRPAHYVAETVTTVGLFVITMFASFHEQESPEVCVARELRPEIETSQLEFLGFKRTGEYPTGEFILRWDDDPHLERLTQANDYYDKLPTIAHESL